MRRRLTRSGVAAQRRRDAMAPGRGERDVGSFGREVGIDRDTGTAAAEFTMVAALVTIVTLAVLQFALVVHVRNTVQDAAAEGARIAALIGNRPADGIARTTALLHAALGPGYARDVRYGEGRYLDRRAAIVTVAAPLPVLGLFGPVQGLEVSGHAVLEQMPDEAG